MINKSCLPSASFFAWITTAFAFSVRSGIMNNLTKAFTKLKRLNFMGA